MFRYVVMVSVSMSNAMMGIQLVVMDALLHVGYNINTNVRMISEG